MKGKQLQSSLEAQPDHSYTTSSIQNPFPLVIWKSLLLMAVFIYGTHSVIVTLSKENDRIVYSSSSVVFFIELCKLSFSLLFLSNDILEGKIQNQPLKTWLAFSVPAILYCINNNLSVHVLLFIDPASYQILINIKIVTTAIIYRIIIKRSISRTKWIAISLITLAGICNSYGGIMNSASSAPTSSSAHPTKESSIYVTFTGIFLVLIICTISAFAGVYTEYIVKRQFQISLHQQNAMLYSFGVLFNFVTFLSFIINPIEANEGPKQIGYIAGLLALILRLFSGYNKWVVVLIFSEACGGLILSAVMKYASNITKLFIISSAMIVTTIFSILLFSLQLNSYFIIGLSLVLFALYLNQKG